MKSNNKLLKILAEGILIVFSILLAFAIQAWWDERKERIEEHKLLVNRQTDFTKNKELLESSIGRFTMTIKNSQRFMDYIQPGQPPSERQLADSVLFKHLLWHTYDPIVGTLNSAIASGHISLIENEGLRTELAEWQDLVEDMKESERIDIDIMTRINEEIFRYVPTRTMAYRAGNDFMLRESTATTDYLKLQSSLYLENLLGNRIGEMSVTLNEADKVMTSLTRIIEMLENELSK
jgi:hypothetical protein